MHSGSQFLAVLLGAGKVLAPLGLKSAGECERSERAEGAGARNLGVAGFSAPPQPDIRTSKER